MTGPKLRNFISGHFEVINYISGDHHKSPEIIDYWDGNSDFKECITKITQNFSLKF